MPVRNDRAKNDLDAIGRTLTLATSLAVTLGVVIAALFYKYSAGILSVMGAPPEVIGLAVPYLRWRASAFPANLFLLVACGAFRYAGSIAVSLSSYDTCRGAVVLLKTLSVVFGIGPRTRLSDSVVH